MWENCLYIWECLQKNLIKTHSKHRMVMVKYKQFWSYHCYKKWPKCRFHCKCCSSKTFAAIPPLCPPFGNRRCCSTALTHIPATCGAFRTCTSYNNQHYLLFFDSIPPCEWPVATTAHASNITKCLAILPRAMAHCRQSVPPTLRP